MKKFAIVLSIVFFINHESAFACKIGMNFDVSTRNIQTLLSVAAKTGNYEGLRISKIEPIIGSGHARIELKNASGACKTLLFSARQPHCYYEYKFLKEEACK